MIDREKLINMMAHRQAALLHLINRDVTGNTLAVLEAWREVKYWKEAIERNEFTDFEYEYYKEDSEWLLKIRDELSDIDFPDGVLEYSIAKPEGIYQMVKELKRMFKEDNND